MLGVGKCVCGARASAADQHIVFVAVICYNAASPTPRRAAEVDFFIFIVKCMRRVVTIFLGHESLPCLL